LILVFIKINYYRGCSLWKGGISSEISFVPLTLGKGKRNYRNATQCSGVVCLLPHLKEYNMTCVFLLFFVMEHVFFLKSFFIMKDCFLLFFIIKRFVSCFFIMEHDCFYCFSMMKHVFFIEFYNETFFVLIVLL